MHPDERRGVGGAECQVYTDITESACIRTSLKVSDSVKIISFLILGVSILSLITIMWLETYQGGKQ